MWWIKQTDDATYNLFGTSWGDLVLRPALEKETVGEWVLMLGGEEEGETDILTQRLWLNEAEMEREREKQLEDEELDTESQRAGKRRGGSSAFMSIPED